MNTYNQLLRDFKIRNFKPFSSGYEPVGCEVLVMTKDHEVLRAVRKTPAQGYNNPNEYYRVVDGKVTEEVIKPVLWDYT